MRSRGELAEALDIPEAAVVETMRFAAGTLSLSEPLADDSATELGDLVEDHSQPSPYDAALLALLPGEVSTLLSALNEREQLIISLRYGLDRGEPPPAHSRRSVNISASLANASVRSKPKQCRNSATPPTPTKRAACSTRNRYQAWALAKQFRRAEIPSEVGAVLGLGARARDELGQHPLSTARPLQAAWVSAASFALGALFPLLTFILAPTTSRVALIAVSALAALGALGALGVQVGGAPRGKAAMRVFVGGGLAMGVTALVGHLAGSICI